MNFANSPNSLYNEEFQRVMNFNELKKKQEKQSNTHIQGFEDSESDDENSEVGLVSFVQTGFAQGLSE